LSTTADRFILLALPFSHTALCQQLLGQFIEFFASKTDIPHENVVSCGIPSVDNTISAIRDPVVTLQNCSKWPAKTGFTLEDSNLVQNPVTHPRISDPSEIIP
jgi:hypothetical protein